MGVLPVATTVRQLQSKIRYKFKNPQYLWEAVQAPGAIIRAGAILGAGTIRHSEGFERLPDGNRRLAILGDTVIKLALVENWYKGDETRERISVVVADVGSNANLERVGRAHRLEKLINDNPSQVAKGIGISPNTMAGTVEAIVGAVYLDGGMKSVPRVMQNLGLMPRLIRKIECEQIPAATSNEKPKKAEMGLPSPHEVLASGVLADMMSDVESKLDIPKA